MNYMEISHCNQINGSGMRCVLWISGCSHKCPGCQNPFSHDPNVGIKFDEKAKKEIFSDLETDWCSGITLSGGDPLYEGNRKEVIELCKEIKEKFPNKNIWLYTGYTWSEILNDNTMFDILNYIDVLCDGPYIESLKNIDLQWVGSSNQQVIDVKDRIKKINNINHV